MKILIIEDNKKIAEYITKALEYEGYGVSCAYDGVYGQKRAETGTFDVIILDIMLPQKNGVDVCRSLREQNITTPIILLTAKDDITDKIDGLDSGADDYVVKPFVLDELLARIRSLVRRCENRVGKIITVNGISIDIKTWTVTKNNNKILLTNKEFDILYQLMVNAGLVMTRDQILQKCWDFSFEADSNVVEVYIKQIRKKIDDKDCTHIKTIRNVGYIFEK